MYRTLVLLLLAACSGGKDLADDTDAADDTDPVDVADDTDASDDTDPPALTAADLAGTFLGNSPVEACYATILNQTVVELTAVDADTVTIDDGTHTFSCDLVGTTLVCPGVNGVTSSVAVGPDMYCDWPYTVDVTIVGVTADQFDAAVTFATTPSPTSPTCASILSTCRGAASATFARWVRPTPEAPTPPKKAMVAPSP